MTKNKYFIWASFISLVMFCGTTALGQQSANYGADDLIIDGPNGPEHFLVRSDLMLVGFAPDQDPLSIQESINAFSDLKRIETDLIAPYAGFRFVRTRSGMTASQIQQLASSMRGQSAIQYVNPVLEYKDGNFQVCTDRLIIGLHSDNDLFVMETIAANKGMKIVRKLRNSPPAFVLQASPGSDIPSLAAELTDIEAFRFVEPEFVRLLKPATSDPLYYLQWELENTGSSAQYSGTPGADLDVNCAWGSATGNDVVVAVIDEGVDLSHPDLAANLLPGYDAVFANGGTTVNTFGGPRAGSNDAHGTSCSGIIGAVANNGLGTAGIAYNSKILPVRIAYSSGFYWVTDDAWIADAIDWAVANGADILSNSWGGGAPATILDDAFTNAVNNGRNGKGSVVLAASGNDNGSLIYPASLDVIIAVGGSSMCDTRKSPSSCDGETWWGANYGTGLDVVAPAVKIATTDISGSAGYDSGDYQTIFNGTSSACPAAAGVVALIMSVDTNMSATAARYYLESSVEKVGPYSYGPVAGQPNGDWNNQMGYGRVNACAAVSAVGSPVPGEYCYGYCTSGSMTTADEWIEEVHFGTLNNVSGNNGGSADFGTSFPADFARSSVLSFDLVPGFSSTAYDEDWRIWMDLNGDGDFDDVGEMLFETPSPTSVNVTGSVTIPPTADTGRTKLRIQMKAGGLPTACETFMWGETEDYCIRITDSTTLCNTPVNLNSNVLSSTTVTISWYTVAEAVQYNLEGRKLGGSTWRAFSSFDTLRTFGIFKPSKSYEWKVKSVCAGSESDWSAIQSFTTPALRKGAVTDTDFKLYPNPASDVVNLQLYSETDGNGQVVLIDVTGKISLTQPMSWQAGNAVLPLDVSLLSPGIYQLQLQTAFETYGARLVIGKH